MAIPDVATALLNAISGFGTGYMNTGTNVMMQKRQEGVEKGKELRAREEERIAREETLGLQREGMRQEQEYRQGMLSEADQRGKEASKFEQQRIDLEKQRLEADKRNQELGMQLAFTQGLMRLKDEQASLEKAMMQWDFERKISGAPIVPGSQQDLDARALEFQQKFMQDMYKNADIASDPKTLTQRMFEVKTMTIEQFGTLGSPQANRNWNESFGKQFPQYMINDPRLTGTESGASGSTPKATTTMEGGTGNISPGNIIRGLWNIGAAGRNFILSSVGEGIKSELGKVSSVKEFIGKNKKTGAWTPESAPIEKGTTIHKSISTNTPAAELRFPQYSRMSIMGTSPSSALEDTLNVILGTDRNIDRIRNARKSTMVGKYRKERNVTHTTVK